MTLGLATLPSKCRLTQQLLTDSKTLQILLDCGQNISCKLHLLTICYTSYYSVTGCSVFGQLIVNFCSSFVTHTNMFSYFANVNNFAE